MTATRLAIIENNKIVDEIKTPFFNLSPISMDRYKENWITRNKHSGYGIGISMIEDEHEMKRRRK